MKKDVFSGFNSSLLTVTGCYIRASVFVNHQIGSLLIAYAPSFKDQSLWVYFLYQVIHYDALKIDNVSCRIIFDTSLFTCKIHVPATSMARPCCIWAS